MIQLKGNHKEIALMDSLNQAYAGEEYSLGIDAEILPRKGDEILYPHLVGCPQQRGHEAWIYKQEGKYHRSDWHGDGYAFEVCTKPTHCLDVLMTFTGRAFEFLNQKFKTPMQFEVPTIYGVAPHIVESAPEEVRMLGCSPSLNIYEDPGDPESLGSDARTTGCHLHISHNKMTMDVVRAAVKWTDLLTGNIWNVISPEDPAIEAARRKAYGRAGEHRRNIYKETDTPMTGFEYRVLPGRVLGNQQYLTLLMNSMRMATTLAFENGEADELLSEATRVAINSADKRLSRIILGKLPMDKPSRAYIKYLAENPLAPIDMEGWAHVAVSNYGHQKHFQQLVSTGKIAL